MRNLHTFFLSWLSLFIISPKTYESFLYSTPSPSLITFCLFGKSYSNRHEVVSHCGFDLHFPNNLWCLTCVLVPVGSLYHFYGKIYIKILYPWFYFTHLLLKHTLLFVNAKKSVMEAEKKQTLKELQFSSVTQSCLTLCDPMNHSTPTSLFITNTQSPPKPMSIKSVMPSNHLILCHTLLLLPSIFPSIRVFSTESALCIRWPKYWSFSFNISPSN